MTKTTETIIDSFHEDDSYLNEFDTAEAIAYGTGFVAIIGIILSIILPVLA